MRRFVPEFIVAACIILWFPATALTMASLGALTRFALGEAGALFVLPIAGPASLYVLLGMAPRWVERWQLGALAQRTIVEENARLSPIVLPFTIAVSVLTDLVLLRVMLRGDHSRKGDELLYLLLFGGVILMLYALFYNRLPNHSRRLKYELACIGSHWVTFAFALGENWAPLVVFDLLAVPLWATLASVLAYQRFQPTEPLVVGRPATRFTMKAYRGTMTWGPGSGLLHFLAWLLVRVTAVTFHGYMTIRYMAKERMASRPALYFRSFTHPHIGPLFGKLLAPTIGRRFVLEPLVHRSQMAAAIYRKAHPGWHGRAIVLPDEGWQARVEEKLRSCSVVLIDVTVPTETLAWEIQSALRMVPHSRIAFLLPKGHSRSLPPTVAVIEYDTTRPGDSRATLNKWIDAVCDDVFARKEDQVRSRVAVM